MKTKFLKEKKAFEEATEARIRAMADSANKVITIVSSVSAHVLAL